MNLVYILVLVLVTLTGFCENVNNGWIHVTDLSNIISLLFGVAAFTIILEKQSCEEAIQATSSECDDPPDIPVGMVLESEDGNKVGSVRNVICGCNQDPDPISKIICQIDLQWGPEIPVCRRGCDNPFP